MTGELKCDPTAPGRDAIQAGSLLLMQRNDIGMTQVRVSGVRTHGKRLLVRLDGIKSRSQAESYAGATLHAPRNQITLDAGEYLAQDLAGCALYDVQGALIGRVDGVQHYPGTDMLACGEWLIPMVSAFIKHIDLAQRSITVDLPPGLLNDGEAETA